MRSQFIFLFILLDFSGFCQQIDWAKAAIIPAASKGLVCDNYGNVFNYGSNLPRFYTIQYYNWWITALQNDTVGSFLNKYDGNGNLIFSKKWKGSFGIQKIISDGSNLYFTGIFSGTIVVDGKTISSSGGTEGMVGCIDLYGNIVWIKTFGSKKDDLANGLTFNPNKSKIIITGNIADTLHYSGLMVSAATERSLLLAEINLSGNLTNHKLIDFYPGRNVSNCGMEIEGDPNGNYTIHVEREGKYCGEDTSHAPLFGNYLIKTDQAFNIQWQKYIIDGCTCYYGYDCGGLCVNNIGDSFFPVYGAAKYGGTPTVNRYSQDSAKKVWGTPSNEDGHYGRSYSYNGSLYIIGIEGESDCPCEGNHSGYQVIKKYDSNNQLKGELRLLGIWAGDLIKAPNGKLYIVGSFAGSSKVIGKDTVKALNGHSNFIAGLSDIECQAVAIDNNTINYWRPKLFCDTLTLDAGSGYTNYLWSNGSTNRFLKATAPGWYTVRVTEASGCVANSMGTYTEKRPAPVNPGIYLVTYDWNTKKNKVEWHPSYDDSASTYLLYKKSTTGIVSVDTFKNAYAGYDYTDSLKWSDTSAVTYYLNTFSRCDQFSGQSPVHTSMFLKLERQGNDNVLKWNSYVGMNYTKAYILRGSYPYSLNIYDSVSNTSTNYIDVMPSGKYYYQVMVTDKYKSSLSNPVGDLSIGVQEITQQATNMTAYPNPFTGELYLKTSLKNNEDVQVRVVSITGETVYEESRKIAKGEYIWKITFYSAPGVYYIQARGTQTYFNQKIIRVN